MNRSTCSCRRHIRQPAALLTVKAVMAIWGLPVMTATCLQAAHQGI